jgi:hypothetical protein
MPGRQPCRRSPIRVQQAVSTHPVPSSGTRLSSPSGVQSPGFIVRDPASGRLVSTGPVSSRLVSAPVRPDASAWSAIRRWRLGTADAARQPAPRERAQVPVGCRVVERLGRRSSRPGHRRRRRGHAWSAGCRWRTSAGSGAGGGRLTLASWAGQAGVPSARRRRLREGTARGRSARLPHRPGGYRPRDGWSDHPAWWSWRLRPAWTGPEGPIGLPAGRGVRPQRGPGWQRAFPACCQQRSDLLCWLVGLPGLEPGTSSLSGTFAGCV